MPMDTKRELVLIAITVYVSQGGQCPVLFSSGIPGTQKHNVGIKPFLVTSLEVQISLSVFFTGTKMRDSCVKLFPASKILVSDGGVLCLIKQILIASQFVGSPLRNSFR